MHVNNNDLNNKPTIRGFYFFMVLQTFSVWQRNDLHPRKNCFFFLPGSKSHSCSESGKYFGFCDFSIVLKVPGIPGTTHYRGGQPYSGWLTQRRSRDLTLSKFVFWLTIVFRKRGKIVLITSIPNREISSYSFSTMFRGCFSANILGSPKSLSPPPELAP